jgi:hypothetical protein
MNKIYNSTGLNEAVLQSQTIEDVGNFPPDESFQAIPSLLLKDLRRMNQEGEPVLQHIDVALYALLKSHSRMKGRCHPSLERLSVLAARSVSTVQRSLGRLEQAGHIQRKTHNKGKIFILTDVDAKGQIVRRPRYTFVPRRRPNAATYSASETPNYNHDRTTGAQDLPEELPVGDKNLDLGDEEAL